MAGGSTDGNTVFSPIGLQIAFSMIMMGSQKTTKEELKRCLEIKSGAEDEEWQKVFSILLSGMRKEGEKMIIMATRLYFDSKVPVDNKYKEALKKLFHLDPAELNMNDPSRTAKSINSAISVMTQGKFQAIIDLCKLKPGMDVLLVNAVYFRGLFKTPFLRASTKEGPFSLLNGSTIPVPMMSILENYPAFEESSGPTRVQVVSIPFYQSVYSLCILLPPVAQFLQFEKSLTADKIQLYMKSMYNVNVNLKMPKFKVKSKFDLNPIMKTLGAKSVFDIDGATLSGITIKKQICLNYAVHQAYITVEEEGVDVGTNPGGASGERGSTNDRSMTMTVDRPFYVWIWDNKRSVIFLLARIIQP